MTPEDKAVFEAAWKKASNLDCENLYEFQEGWQAALEYARQQPPEHANKTPESIHVAGDMHKPVRLSEMELLTAMRDALNRPLLPSHRANYIAMGNAIMDAMQAKAAVAKSKHAVTIDLTPWYNEDGTAYVAGMRGLIKRLEGGPHANEKYRAAEKHVREQFDLDGVLPLVDALRDVVKLSSDNALYLGGLEQFNSIQSKIYKTQLVAQAALAKWEGK